MGDKLARLEDMLMGVPLEIATSKLPFSRELEASHVDQGVKITGLELFDGTTDPMII